MENQIRNGYLTIPLIPFCIILLAGCGRSTGPVQNEGEATSITLEEILRLGDESAGDTILFGPIAQIAVNGDGDILVSEGQRSPLVHVFGPDGTHLSQVGDRGQGPGEYQYLSGAVIGAADSVYLWEFVTNRILIYDPDDFSYVRSVEVRDDGEKQFNSLIGAIGDGWIMTKSLSPFLESDDGTMTINDNTHYELIKINRDGSYGTDIIGTVDEYEMIYNLEEGGGMNFVWTPFGRSPSWAVGPDDMLYYGWSDKIEIVTVSADESTRDTIRYEHEPVPITSAEMAEAMPEEPHYRELVEAREPHETKPAFQTFVVDEVNRIWIKLSSPEDAVQAEWLILSRESHAVGRATLPVAVDLEVIRGGHAYGIHQGDGAAPMVVVYKIQE
ncbi:MAG: 6-bladed beta-propeller [Rhodothermaceae bacterium]|nr:6-bladed beta-propeller [Bacteroidota bacterium]MXZ57495.1 6-bladed beta-propeller [Rhodothermaceae bacterium]MYB90479.1 6-bladed beta-propeller [Rhodothermaceae bacterium]MYD68214.1 6-bladed beta-propeller [Rhodothermaceae bacterium]MYG44205.1 6-bladed beta-propeller [Rhodothermaceae bacterium]